MRTRTLATLALTLATTVAFAQPKPPPPNFPPDHPVSVLDPQLPQDLHPGMRHQFLDELEHTISSLVRGVRVIRSEATETLVVWADEGQLQKARKLATELKAKLVARAGDERGSSPEREGAPVRTVVQVVIASNGREKPRHPLDPALAGPLSKAMGYSRFEVVGHAMAEGSVGEETQITARMPWTDESPVGLHAVLVPFADDLGVRVKAEFSVASEFDGEEVHEEVEIIHERDEEYEEEHEDRRIRRHEEERDHGQEDDREIVEGSVETTYRPRPGRPLVVGATPMGDSNTTPRSQRRRVLRGPGGAADSCGEDERTPMNLDRFAALEDDLNREFGKKKDWHHYFQLFQTWLERHVLASVRRLATEATG
jgi:hypothetical protein